MVKFTFPKSQKDRRLFEAIAEEREIRQRQKFLQEESKENKRLQEVMKARNRAAYQERIRAEERARLNAKQREEAAKRGAARARAQRQGPSLLSQLLEEPKKPRKRKPKSKKGKEKGLTKQEQEQLRFLLRKLNR